MTDIHEINDNMALVWNKYVVKRFQSIPPNPRENDFHAPYDKLLNTEFKTDGRFTVAPQAYPQRDTRETIDFFVEYTIEIDDKPVFIVEIKSPSKLTVSSSREEADFQLRRRLIDIAPLCPLDTLYGMSAFGTQYAIYKYSKSNRFIEPRVIPSDPVYITDTAPVERWGKDLMKNDGAIELRKLFQIIIESCEDIE